MNRILDERIIRWLGIFKRVFLGWKDDGENF